MKRILIFYLVSLFLIFVLLTSCKSRPIQTIADVTSTSRYEGASLTTAKTAASTYCSPEFKNVYFFGDSTTHGLIRYNAENNGELGEPLYRISASRVITPLGNTFYLGNLASARINISGENVKIDEAIGRISPKILIITVGLNGLNYWDKETFVKYYESMLHSMAEKSANTKFVLQSVFPIAETRSEDFTRLIPERIPLINEWIREIAENYSLSYLDTYSHLINESGYLPDEFHNGDGIHLSCEGYNAIMKYITESGVTE